MKAYASLVCFILLTSSAFAQQKAQPKAQAVSIGQWDITTNYKAGKFDSCSMTRTAGELGISFVRAEDGLSLLLEFGQVEARAWQHLPCSSESRRAIRASKSAGRNEGRRNLPHGQFV